MLSAVFEEMLRRHPDLSPDVRHTLERIGEQGQLGDSFRASVGPLRLAGYLQHRPH